MSIMFTKHALQQIKLRNIDKSDVIETLNIPEKETNDNYGNKIAQKKFGDYLLRVFYLEENKIKVVITAYKTSKISKYL